MAMGMTYEQYWYGDVLMVKAFRKADQIRQDRMNSEAWLQGMYIYDAISRLFPLPAVFVDSKTIKGRPYPEQPYGLTKAEREEAEKVDPKELEKKKAQARGLQAALYEAP